MKKHPYLDSPEKTGRTSSILAVISAICAVIACILILVSGHSVFSSILFVAAAVLEAVLIVFIMHYLHHNAVRSSYLLAVKAFHGLALHCIVLIAVLFATPYGSFAFRFFHAILDGVLGYVLWSLAALCRRQEDSILSKFWLAVAAGIVVGLASWLSPIAADVLLILLGVVLLYNVFVGKRLRSFGTMSILIGIAAILFPALSMLHLMGSAGCTMFLHTLVLILGAFAVSAARHLVPKKAEEPKQDDTVKAAAAAAAVTAAAAAKPEAEKAAKPDRAPEKKPEPEKKPQPEKKPAEESAEKPDRAPEQGAPSKALKAEKAPAAKPVAAAAAGAGAAAVAAAAVGRHSAPASLGRHAAAASHSEMNLRAALTPKWRDAALQDILNAPLTALDGMSDAQARTLKETLGISTVGALGTNKFIRWAQAITTVAERED